MTEKVIKIGVVEKDEKFIKPGKEILEKLKGKVIILNPEESEIARNLEIKEKGVYGIRFR